MMVDGIKLHAEVGSKILWPDQKFPWCIFLIEWSVYASNAQTKAGSSDK